MAVSSEPSKRAKALADAAESCWQAIQHQNIVDFGRSLRQGFDAQIAMFPNMVTPTVAEMVAAYRERALGWKISGAGGGGYLILVAEAPIPDAMRCVVRRRLE